MTKGKSIEQLFVAYAKSAGLAVEHPRLIKIQNPVTNRNGLLTKTITVPDAYILDPLSGNCAHVEITNGRGLNEHKAAQLRVVEVAGVSIAP